MKRIIYDELSGNPVSRYQLEEHVEILPNIWLPRTIKNIQFDFGANDSKEAARQVMNSAVSVLHYKVNEVEDTRFNYYPEPGALQIAQDGSFVQTHPGGMEQLDVLHEWVVNRMPRRNTHGQLFIMFFVVMAFCTIVFFEQCMRSARSRVA